MKAARRKEINEFAQLSTLRTMITYPGFQQLNLVNLGVLIKEVDERIEKSRCKALA